MTNFSLEVLNPLVLLCGFLLYIKKKRLKKIEKETIYLITAIPLSTAKSVFCKFVEILLVVRDLLSRRADLKIAQETFVGINDMVAAYSSPFLSARSSAILTGIFYILRPFLLWY